MGWMLYTYIVVLVFFILMRIFGFFTGVATVFLGLMIMAFAWPFGFSDSKSFFLLVMGASVIFTLFAPVIV